jgi:transcriptional regulator with XRE-family HTH domain
LEDFKSIFGERVKQLRKERCVSLEVMSHHTNIEKKHLWLIEKGSVNITLLTLKKICDYFEISLSSFFNF